MNSKIKRIIREAEKEADHVQINIGSVTHKSLTINNNSYQSFEETEKGKYQIRVWKNQAMGYAYSNRLTKDTLRQAIKICKANDRLDYFHGIPNRSRYSNIRCHDKKVAELTKAEMSSMADVIIDECVKSGIIASHVAIEAKHEESQIFNSNGIEGEQKRTEFGLWANTIARSGANVSSYWNSMTEVKLFDIIPFIDDLKRKTYDFLYPRKMERKARYVLFKPKTAADLIHNALVPNFSAKNIEKNKSVYKGKTGKSIAHPKLSLVDDGTLEWGQNSSRFDYEGTPSQKTVIISNGIFKSPLYDFNTAKRLGQRSTGNRTEQGIDHSNLILTGPYSEIDDALIVETLIGSHTANPATTAFSTKMEHGYYLKKGERIPVKDVMLSGKMDEVLRNIVSVGRKVSNNYGIYTGALACKKVNQTI
ncbi:TldD/PmbA family protein [Candidatus Woesearchaeota archaeon]|nr:TldD/PmbA family protein [Candidatus Woesearchaeota archaeon]